jgi:hypothetical protein
VTDSDEPDLTDEVVADLRDYFESRLPVELWWPGDRMPAPGYVAAVEDDYVVLARLSQMAWLNGFHAVRFTQIQEVLPLDDPDEVFLARAMEAQGEAIPPRLPVRAATLAGFVSVLCPHFPMIIVQTGTGEKAEDVGGTILRVEGRRARMQLMSRRGRWLEGEHELDLSRVTEVWFGSKYERVLERLASLPDGQPG